MSGIKLLVCLLVAVFTWFGGAEGIVVGEAYAQSGPVVRQIRVVGSKRIEPETVRSYLTFSEGQRYDSYKADESLKALIATGLFENVDINQSGGVVTVTISENAIINQVVFEGNKQVKDDTLGGEVQLKPRSVFSRAKVQADVQRILDVYRRSGYYDVTVDAQIIQLDNDRINLAFVIQEGSETKVLNISFLGNKAFSDSTLRGIVTTTENNFLSFLKSTDVYDPDRLNLDRELLRRYYLKNGYADARVVSAVADLDRGGKGFFITFTVEEGELYHFGGIDIESTLPQVDPASLKRDLKTSSGSLYNAEYIDKTTEKLTIAVAEQGYAFGQVRPRIDRDPVNRTISIVYVVEQGPRVYIERINVVGNARTKDYVIRRDIRLAEGDAYNRLMVDQARQRLQNLGFFKSVKVSRDPGTAPDRVIVTFTVEEQPTGELSLAGGFSSAEGPIAEIAYTERNLLGKGQFLQLKLSGSLENTAQAQLSFTEPRFLDKNMSAGFDLFHKETDFSDESGFQETKTGATVRVGFALTDNVFLQPNYTFTRQEIFDVDDDASLAIKDAEGEAFISSVGYSLSYDLRNNKLNPTYGSFFILTQDFAGVGGDVSFIRTVAEARGYYPIYEGITLVGRLIGGHITGLGGEDVRAVDAFFKGGDLIRGFDTAGLGPRDADTGDALGGKIFYAGTVEVRFPLPLVPEELGLSAAVFADAGNVYDTDIPAVIAGNPVNVQDQDIIRSSVGASLLWNSPLGPLRADFAYVITKADFDEEEFFRFGASTKF